MPNWQGSDRRSELPADWSRIRLRILKRDGGQCTEVEHELRCNEDATDVDHIRPGADHRDTNLRSLCSYHHRIKSSSEGGAARQARRREIIQRFRRTEDHPGLL